MKIIIEKDKHGLNIDFDLSGWDYYEVIGVLNVAKHTILKEIDKMVKSRQEGQGAIPIESRKRP